jgi:hypothetical protein
VDALVKLQDPKTGLWHTLLDDPDSYVETSAAAGFAAGIFMATRLVRNLCSAICVHLLTVLTLAGIPIGRPLPRSRKHCTARGHCPDPSRRRGRECVFWNSDGQRSSILPGHQNHSNALWSGLSNVGSGRMGTTSEIAVMHSRIEMSVVIFCDSGIQMSFLRLCNGNDVGLDFHVYTE